MINIQKLKENNSLEQEKAYKQYYDFIYRKAFDSVRNKEIAEDLTIEILTKVFMNMDKYINDISFDSWVKRICINHIIDYIRKNKNKIQTIRCDDFQIPIDPADLQGNPEDKFIDTENIRDLVDAIGKLSKSQLKIFQLRFIDNLKYEEIANIMAMPLGTIKNYIHRGRKKINNLLRKN